MLSEPTYLAARMVAPTIEAHFAQHQAATSQRGDDPLLAPLPVAAITEAIIDAAFWASLRREEGRPPKISLVLLPPTHTAQPLVFGYRRRLTPLNLIKLAPAVEQPGTHLGVWHNQDGLYVWGSVTNVPPLCFVLEVVEPGLLVIKHRRSDGFGKFINVAILRGDQIQVVDEDNLGAAGRPPLRNSLLELLLPPNDEADNILVELAGAMRAHGRGGLVLVVPSDSEQWRASIVQPMSYPVVPSYTSIADLVRQKEKHKNSLEWQQALLHAISIVGGFTAVDGATVITQQYHLLAFGAKVARIANGTPVEQLVVTEPVVGNEAQKIHPAQNGGTRHLAAAQFVHDQRDSLALVASQDGYFTVFTWSEELHMVHAHRIDTLLL